METLVGRVVKNATVNTTKTDKKVVNFSIAVNDNYKAKGDSEVKKVVRYFNCAYWVNTNIAQHLTKGTLAELYGRIGVNTFTNKDGETKASLTFYTNNIKLHGKPATQKAETVLAVVKPINEEAEVGLPF